MCAYLDNEIHEHFSGFEDCLIPISRSLSKVLSSGNLSNSSFVLNLLTCMKTKFLVWPEKQTHETIQSNLIKGLTQHLISLPQQ